jgi:hypothetical protein
MQFGNPKRKSYIKIQVKKSPIKDLRKCSLSKKIENTIQNFILKGLLKMRSKDQF